MGRPEREPGTVVLSVLAATVLLLLPSIAIGSTAASPGSIARSSVTATLAMPEFDFAQIAYNSVNGNLYVAGGPNGISNGSTVVVSGATNRLLATVPVGIEPLSVTIGSGTGAAYVTNLFGTASKIPADTVTVISGASSGVIATVPVGTQPFAAAYDSADQAIYVTNSHSSANYSVGSVSVISTLNNTVIDTIAVGFDPGAILYDRFNGDVYVLGDTHNVAVGVYNAITVISGATNTVIGSISLAGTAPSSMLLDGGNGEVYVGGAHDVLVISSETNQVIATVPIANGTPTFTDALGDVFVVVGGALGDWPASTSTEVSVVSGTSNSVLATYSVGPAGAFVGYDPVTRNVYAQLGTTLIVTSAVTHHAVQTLRLGSGQANCGPCAGQGPLYDPGNGDLYMLVYYVSGDSLFAVSGNATATTAPGPSWFGSAVFLGTGVVIGALAAWGIIGVVHRRRARHAPSPPKSGGSS